MSLSKGLDSVGNNTGLIAPAAGNLTFYNQQRMLEHFFSVTVVGIFKNSNVNQPELVFQSEKNNYFTAAGRRAVGPDHQPGYLDFGPWAKLPISWLVKNFCFCKRKRKNP